MMYMKPIHMLATFYPIKMLGILSAGAQNVEIIVLVWDFGTSADIKKEQQDQLIFPKGVIVIDLHVEFEAIFLQTILKKRGHDYRLIIMVYKVMNIFFARLKSKFETAKIDGFLSEIIKNEKGNISVKCNMHDTRQVILLSYKHAVGRYQASRIDFINKIALQLKRTFC